MPGPHPFYKFLINLETGKEIKKILAKKILEERDKIIDYH